MVCSEHLKQFKVILRSQKLKATPVRLGMLEVFAHYAKPLSIDQLSLKISRKADLVTLYRNTEILAKIGLLNRVRLGGKKDYYEFGKNKHHHHLVCTSCGKVSDVSACKVEFLNNQKLTSLGFATIESHQLEFFGVCKQCV